MQALSMAPIWMSGHENKVLPPLHSDYHDRAWKLGEDAGGLKEKSPPLAQLSLYLLFLLLLPPHALHPTSLILLGVGKILQPFPFLEGNTCLRSRQT